MHPIKADFVDFSFRQWQKHPEQIMALSEECYTVLGIDIPKSKKCRPFNLNESFAVGETVYLTRIFGVERFIIKEVGTTFIVIYQPWYKDFSMGFYLKENYYCLSLTKSMHKARRRKKRILRNYYSKL
jgi:hypothetical protein